jgi:hypothetical protein
MKNERKGAMAHFWERTARRLGRVSLQRVLLQCRLAAPSRVIFAKANNYFDSSLQRTTYPKSSDVQ